MPTITAQDLAQKIAKEWKEKPYHLFYTLTSSSKKSDDEDKTFSKEKKGKSSLRNSFTQGFVQSFRWWSQWIPGLATLNDFIMLSFKDESDFAINFRANLKASLWGSLSPVHLKILGSNNVFGVEIPINPMPSFASSVLIALLTENNNNQIVNINAPEGFFSETQKKTIESISQKNREKMAVKIRQRYWFVAAVILGLLSLSPLYLILSAPTIIASVVFNLIISYISFSLLNKYRNNAAAYYPSFKEIDEIKNKEEKQALIDGYAAGLTLDSKSYCSSYLAMRDLKHPVAFSAGYKMAEKQDDELTKKLGLKK